MKHTEIRPASLSWQDNTPVSEQFDDIYFNKDGGMAETEYVFLQSNNLEQRFIDLDKRIFTIAETGFGTGLNFLCARDLWLKHSVESQSLHFISVEKFPLSKENLRQALSHWPQLSSGSEQLIEHYPAAINGFHRIVMDGGRVQLTLMLGDSDHCFPALDTPIVDAWFLDGFAPAKNPEMWSDTLFQAIAERSQPTTTFATFTAAGIVKRGLKGAGFNVRKIPGFGRKREMLVGEYSNEHHPTHFSAPWFQRPVTERTFQPADNKHICIIGAGLAGCTTARALADRGYSVTLVDKHAEPAQEGSGNRQGALYAKPTLEQTKQSRFHLTGMQFSQQRLKQMNPNQDWWQACGVMISAQSPKVEERFEQICQQGHIPAEVLKPLTAVQASEYCGYQVPFSALLFPDAGWVSPVKFCHNLLDHPLITAIYGQHISDLQWNRETEQWMLSSTDQNFTADIVVVATAQMAVNFAQCSSMPLKAIRGQVTHCKASSDKPELKTVVCSDGYISPPVNGEYCFGATFDLKDPDSELREGDQQKNLKTLAVALPELAEQLSPAVKAEGRVSYRCATSDYLPIIGELPDETRFTEQYAKLRNDAKWPFDQTAPARHQNLFINVGHGSKGLITAPLGAELLASYISQEPLPVDREIADALDPARFLVKKLIKQAI